MKNVEPSAAHKAYHEAIRALVNAHENALSAGEIIGITAYFVGQLIANVDAGTTTVEETMELVQANLLAGNQAELQDILAEAKAGGTA